MKRVAYLSGSPLVSTCETTSLPGPRSHILGVIQGFRANNCEVNQFVFGDHFQRWAKAGSTRPGAGRSARPLLWDLGRIGFGWLSRFLALNKLGLAHELAYERYGLFQALGRPFQRRGITWILETNAPLAYEAHLDRSSSSLFKLALRHELRAYRNCDVLVCVSEKLKKILVEDYQVDPKKIIIIPNAVNIEKFDPMLFEPIRHFENFTLGFVGKLFPWQGLDTVIRVLCDLRREGKKISLVVVGDGSMLGELEAMAKNLGIYDDVRFTGWVSPNVVPSMIKGFDLCISAHSQPKKGHLYFSPLKLYEYMAMAKPVVASASGDAVKLIHDGQNGFLFTPGNQNELKFAIDRAYATRSALPAMGQQARQLIVNEHSWARRVGHLLEQIPNILRR